MNDLFNLNNKININMYVGTKLAPEIQSERKKIIHKCDRHFDVFAKQM
jgi:hypothetical protein